ncbi:MAG: endonuclease [Bacteroidales bacterium]
MKHICLTGLIVFSVVLGFTQQEGQGLPEDYDPSPRGEDGLRLMFYNVENLFDTQDDTLKRDEEFLPDGARNWNSYRYWEKINHLASVIVSIGGWEPPAVVGLCEVENLNALKALFYGSGLKKYQYEIVHYESPDVRGIDNALAYQKKKLTLLHSEAIPVFLGNKYKRPTRDILYVKMKTLTNDTLHIFVNHWSSRWGGEEATRPKRIQAAQALRSVIDSLEAIPHEQNIVIMGDFNDTPENESIYKTLMARDSAANTYLVNLMRPWLSANKGTHFYKEATGAQWSILDQIIVSRPLLNPGGLKTSSRAHIFDADFLMTEDDGVRKPHRSFLGFKYIGGYSDHLPIYIDVFHLSKFD